jgi:hypothetical protein
MKTLKPQNRKTSQGEETHSNTIEYSVGAGYETHDDYESMYSDGYDTYYNGDDADDDYTSWSE